MHNINKILRRNVATIKEKGTTKKKVDMKEVNIKKIIGKKGRSKVKNIKEVAEEDKKDKCSNVAVSMI